MHTFDYSFLKGLGLTPAFSKCLSRIEVYRENSKRFVENNADVVSDMIGVAKVMSVRESNAIEGIGTHDARLFDLLSNKVRPLGHDEYELLGYRDALERIHTDHDEMDVDEETILSIFSTLVSYTDIEPAFKRSNNEVVERDQDGRVTRRFKTVPAKDVDDAMFQLVSAFMEARADMGINNLLLIPCFIMDFLKIHPFMDGNGRISRLLTTLLLYQEGYDVCAYVSLEAIINQSKDDYYEALAQSGEGWFDDINDYMPIIDYFIGVIFLAYREFDRRMAMCVGKGSKQERVEQALLNIFIPISKSALCSLMPDISEAYVELVIARLVKEGRIEKIGVKKGTRYIPVR